MSFWLKNVGHFLEKLDGQAERVVEERIRGTSNQEEDEEEERLDSILAARGLEGEEEDDDEEEEEEENEKDNNNINIQDNRGGAPLVDPNHSSVEEEQQQQQQQQQEFSEGFFNDDAIFNKADDTDGLEDGAAAAAAVQDVHYKEDHPSTPRLSLPVEADADRNNSFGNDSAVMDAAAAAGAGESTPIYKENASSTLSLLNYSEDDNHDDNPDDPNNDEDLPAALFMDAAATAALENDNDASDKEIHLETASNSSPPSAPASSSNIINALLVDAAKDGAASVTPSNNKPAFASSADLSQSNAASQQQQQQLEKALELARAAQKEAQAAAREAQKETRILRRHVLKLNKQLETAESELSAQRVELDGAAERMEKDRVKHKEEREKEKARLADDMKSLKAQHEQAMKELKQRCDQQVEEIRRQLNELEYRRMQEGGDFHKELADAVQREKEMAEQYALLQDEKATLESRITTLQSQQESLGLRLESLSQTADAAMERERQAEDRLDETLTLHARQISQRQAREAELEQMIADLNAALVQQAPGSSSLSTPSSAVFSNLNNNSNDAAGSLSSRLQSLEQELDNLRAQLEHEQQRSETLQKELQEVSAERKEETALFQTRQSMHDRHVAELNDLVFTLKAQLRDSAATESSSSSSSRNNNNKGTNATSRLDDDNREDARQIKALSEEVLRLREKVLSSNSEISALKSRLHLASDRAIKAETALEEVQITGSRSDTGSSDWEDMERGSGSDLASDKMRRRNPTIGRAGAKRNTLDSVYGGASIRQALRLDDFRAPGESGERIGKALDGLDSFLVTSGKFLRYNPLARLLFIVYLILLHLWTFVLLFVHTHNFDEHADFGVAGGVPHGPGSLMMMMMQPPQQQQDAAAAVVQQQQLLPGVANNSTNKT